jgi:hypothetical protein
MRWLKGCNRAIGFAWMASCGEVTRNFSSARKKKAKWTHTVQSESETGESHVWPCFSYPSIRAGVLSFSGASVV